MKKIIVPLALSLLCLPGVAVAAEPPPNEVLHIDHARTAEGFAKGMSLVQNSSYKISTSRRLTPGIVEVHERDTDIFYVLEGSATFVTGGTTVEAKPSGPAEIRAASITGGVSRQLAKGDVIVIPNGVPHWFKEVQGPFVYLVVKVTK